KILININILSINNHKKVFTNNEVNYLMKILPFKIQSIYILFKQKYFITKFQNKIYQRFQGIKLFQQVILKVYKYAKRKNVLLYNHQTIKIINCYSISDMKSSIIIDFL
ncbi:hypothetical protein IMG5_155180, partial [Ichthyophthirius multifiliis]